MIKKPYFIVDILKGAAVGISKDGGLPRSFNTMEPFDNGYVSIRLPMTDTQSYRFAGASGFKL